MTRVAARGHHLERAPVSAERRLLILLLCAPLLGFIGVMAADAVSSTRIADHLIDAERADILTET
jgi:hypothetical protein